MHSAKIGAVPPGPETGPSPAASSMYLFITLLKIFLQGMQWT